MIFILLCEPLAGRKVIIPFAVERTQDLIYTLASGYNRRPKCDHN